MRARSQSGFTFVEVTLTFLIFGLLLSLYGQGLAASSGLADQSHARLRAVEDSRRNLRAIADRLRGGAIATLTGFAGGVATDLSFQTVASATNGVRTLGPATQLVWRSSAAPVEGVAYPGEVVATQSGVTTVIAPRVPSGGFQVTQLGNTLVVLLTTYHAYRGHAPALVTDRISVCLRN